MKCIRARDIYCIGKDLKNKKVILYGSGKFANDIICKFMCLDIEVAYCIEDNFNHIVVQKQVSDVFSLLLEKEKFFVVIAKEEISFCAKVLNGLGLEYLKDYNFIKGAGRIKLENIFALDPILGYSLPYEETQGDGVKVYGDITDAEMIIAVLGGSTSDPCAYTWKSWGELLYKRGCIEKKKIAVVIGAVCGYSTSEELFKLIRDILVWNPDIIISYSGVNDRTTIYPYINSYQRELYNKLSLLKQQGMYKLGYPDKVCYGVRNKVKPSEKWIKNQKIMYAIAREFGIKYIAFFQPSLISKKRGEQDEEILFYEEERETKEKELYIQEVKQILAQEKKDYIVDATNWFDHIDGIFYDFCHVMEEGNQYIADKIYEYLF